MKVSENWLRSLTNPSLSLPEVADQLTNAGIEVDSLEWVEAIQEPDAKKSENKQKEGILTLKIPANRGDCLSMEGVAREVSLLNNLAYNTVTETQIKPTLADGIPVHVEAHDQCPRYLGCTVKNINNRAATPNWLINRLKMGGIRSVSPVVDILNYVMLECGQPLHAFDAEKINSEIVIRKSKKGERVTLLDNQEKILEADTLVIADKKNVLAIAGVMGSLDSGVSENTREIFIESAYFDPIAIRKAAKQYNLRTDASHRFERGVDPSLQKRALNRVLQLLLEITGGSVSKIFEESQEKFLPKSPSILLRRERITKILGITFPDAKVSQILEQLGMKLVGESAGWRVTPPSFRHDINLEIDLIEEIARIVGLMNLPSESITAKIQYPLVSEMEIPVSRFKAILADRGYSEAITYSFIDPKWTLLFDPNHQPYQLSNPISAEMAAMRSSLFPGLLQAIEYNQRRQILGMRFFEIGTCFLSAPTKKSGSEKSIVPIEKQVLAGVCSGSRYKEQWGEALRPVDFYDVKNDVEALLNLVKDQNVSFETAEHPALHPGQTAKVLREGQTIGFIGALHPRIQKALSLEGPIVLFELELDSLQKTAIPVFSSLSKFPAIRRDIAILVDKTVKGSELSSELKQAAGPFCKSVMLFDVYQGKGIDPGKKSVALGLILQHPSRTLIESEINQIMDAVVSRLMEQFQAVLRM